MGYPTKNINPMNYIDTFGVKYARGSMGERRIKASVVAVSILIILGTLSVIIAFNLETVQEYFEGVKDYFDGDSKTDDDPNKKNEPDSPHQTPEDGTPISQALNRLLSSSSSRKISDKTTVVSSDSEFYPLIGTPIATNYNEHLKNPKPLLVSGPAASSFLEIYNSSDIITLGNVGGISGKYNYKGNEKSVSLDAAVNIWSNSNGALIISENSIGYELGVAATPLAAYLNIPVIVTNTMDESVKSTLSRLGVSYTLVCGSFSSYGETYYLTTLEDIYRLTIDFLSARFNGVSYITLINSEDVHSNYGISEISSLAPYLSSSRSGMVLNCPQSRMESGAFEQSEENIAKAANNLNLDIKKKQNELFQLLDEHGFYDNYLYNNPYFAILGDPYSIPFYYFENPNPSTSSGADDKWVATDDLYADIDEDPHYVELALGRVLALSKSGTSALISRSICYSEYMQQWIATSIMNDAKGSEWRDTAYAGKGDDWNGAMYVMTREYWEEVAYLQNQGYTVHTTQRRATGATVSQDILEYYSSSNMIYVMAHGSADGYQMTDGITASDVKNWEMGPSVQLLTSCSAARTDVPNIQDTISLAFIEVGVNSYIGGSRTESSADSPTLSANAIESMVSSDESVGIACRNAKNLFMESDSNYEHSAMRVLYGEPAFDPFQP
jgi:hypothetical protein